jgi:hypothetical protein
MIIEPGNQPSDTRELVPMHWVGQRTLTLYHRWGASLYEWYKSHPDKSARFDRAMEGVAQCMFWTPLIPRTIEVTGTNSP